MTLYHITNEVCTVIVIDPWDPSAHSNYRFIYFRNARCPWVETRELDGKRTKKESKYIGRRHVRVTPRSAHASTAAKTTAENRHFARTSKPIIIIVMPIFFP